ncbi:GyrI-like domain-containing protein [Paenibacillus sp. BSR1-1]|uniref:GyrI-like domain-containing protein n=1 Tax=Paenibacillus sp. BSR1-1 TaxID=3020845 RepID=UPI0025B27866|nr:GyrI-like domain-containing protein [Paenibacillus sp. BSR1-1]MDN3015260.1 GyrI-like domain-containing protein [Paenibacillus sp. BSR1-1]
MGIQVVEKEEIKVVGISWSGTYSEGEIIPSLFKKMENRLSEVPNQTVEPVLIAPFHSRETEFTYYVTKPVEKIETIPEGMVGFSIPRKNYVVGVHKGTQEEVKNTYLQMFEWMKEYGYEQDHHALSLEVYKEEHKQQNVNGDLHFEIYLPVKTY